MAKTTKLKNILKLSEFPERKTIEKTEDCTFKVTEYGDKSYTDQLAVVTHFLHNVGNIGDSQEKEKPTWKLSATLGTICTMYYQT